MLRFTLYRIFLLSFYGFEVCNVGMQRNIFLRLIKFIKQRKFYLNLYYKVILYYKTLNLHTKLTLISINLKHNELFFLFRCTQTLRTSDP